MIKLNDKELFKLFDKHLRVFYPAFKEKKLNMEYIFDQKTVSYDYILRRLHFNSFIINFQFDGDHLRKFTYHEAVNMIKKEYPEAKVNLELYIENKLNAVANPNKYHEIVNFYCDVEIDDVELTGEQISSMIDLALVTRSENCDNEEWLTELSLRYQPFLKANS
ncbi:hypothetical protein DFQ00_102229 [Paenibacillus barcinonensis]|uniref:IDEAL domain-containing protein n=2 Tax=Paenibacillus barcinonensis TaxID=198119 RepID=A0A2V4W002_PAEBA|nr:hypothetical protein DFQ00_102229 [Paenibacillus barcinonensis]